MRLLDHLLFAFRARRRGSRVSLRSYIKGHERLRLGRKCKIHDGASIDVSRGPGVVLGDQVTVNRYAYIQGEAGGVRLGNRVELNNFAIVNGTGGVDIGDDTLVGPGARIISYEHGIAAAATIRSQPTRALPIRIGQDVWIGANAVILAGVSVGDGAVIGAGAVVTSDVASATVVAGVPARPIGSRA
jgi:acetyltransferase-like isoleucine patch superfamily enzyme